MNRLVRLLACLPNIALATVVLPVLLLLESDPVRGEISVSTGQIAPLHITAHTGMKPQSKLWKHDGVWWGCFSDSTGTHVWRMSKDRWIQSPTLTSRTDIRADVLATGDLVEILLFGGRESELVGCHYDSDAQQYGVIRPSVPVPLDEGVETATIARDGDNRLWIASDGVNDVNVRYMNPEDRMFSGPITLHDGIYKDDICVIASLPDGSVGVLWSNQNKKRYGFRRHTAGSAPSDWDPDEEPAGSSAIDHGDGMSDDHLNVAVGQNGTLYATVKSSYDTDGMPLVSCLIRRPNGKWDELYNVDDEGSRGVMVLDEGKQTILSIYTSYSDNAIVLKHSKPDRVSFSDRITLIERPRINNISVSRENVSGSFPLVASQGDTLMHTVILEVK
jgi:hypothetical protein